MRIVRSCRRSLIIGLAVMAGMVASACASEWKASLVPASLNRGRVVNLVAGETQPLTMMLQASTEVQKTAKAHLVELEFDAPTGLAFVETTGVYKLLSSESQHEGGRTLWRYRLEVSKNNLAGTPQQKLPNEWKSQNFYVSAPAAIPADQAYLTLKLISGASTADFRWSLNLHELTEPAQRPRETMLGVWDYDLYRSKEAAEGVGQLLHRSGVGFVQSSTPTFAVAMRKHGVQTGGNVHHSFFHSKEWADQDAKGKALTDYPCPQRVLERTPGAELPGAARLVERALESDGIATLDYEPRGTDGFTPAAISAFQKTYQISDADFTEFRDYVARHDLKVFAAPDEKIRRIWRDWAAFRSQQSAAYMEALRAEVKKLSPEAKVALTCTRTFGDGEATSLALGCNNAAMSPHVDIIMPQLYLGYGGTQTKLVLEWAKGWRDEMTARESKAKLWPIIMARYAGAEVYNSPERLLQQMIGTVANGADGCLVYYSANLDAPYWQAIARATEEIARYEDFYRKGRRVDEKVTFSGLPRGSAEVSVPPGYQATVKNPQWAYTAHELDGKVLVTFFNLEDANDLAFRVISEGSNTQPTTTQFLKEQKDGEFLAAPKSVGYLILGS